MEGIDIRNNSPDHLLLPFQLLFQSCLFVYLRLGAGKHFFHNAFGIHSGCKPGNPVPAHCIN